MLGRLRRRPRAPVRVEPLADGVPRRGLFAELVRVAVLAHERTDLEDAGAVVVFLVEVRDAEDRRCSDLAVEVRVTTPERGTTVVGTTDLMGRLRVRTRGPAGTYRVEVLDVAAGGLAFDPTAGPRVVETAIVVG